MTSEVIVTEEESIIAGEEHAFSKAFEQFVDQCTSIFERTKNELKMYEQEYEEIVQTMQNEMNDQDVQKQNLLSHLQTAQSQIQRFMELLPQSLLNAVRQSLSEGK